MKPSEILIEARKLIEKPENWTQGSYARDANNFEECWLDSKACKFCSVGAVRRSYLNLTGGRITYSLIFPALNYIHNDQEEIIKFNDSQAHAEVLAKFDEAILKAKEDEKQ